jgi:integrase
MKQKIDLDLVSRIEATDKRLHIRDSEIDGFLLRVYPTGALGFYMDYYSPCGDNQGKRVQFKVGGSDLIKFRGDRAMAKPLQQSAVTGFRKSAKAARGLVDAGQDPSQAKRDRRSQRELEAGMRKAEQADKRRVKMAALTEANNTMRKLLAVAEGDTPAGLYTNRLKVNKGGGNERGMLLQAWADIIDTPLTKVTPAKISEINLARLREEDSDDDDDGLLLPSSIDRYNTTGSAFFNWAIDNDLCTDNPFRKQPKYAGSYDFNGDFRYLDPEEAKRLIAAAERMTANHELPGYMYPLTVLALHTGARRGELFTLKWSDINGRMMTLQRGNTKSSKTREIRLTGTAVQAIKDWRTHGGAIKARGLIFPSAQPGKPMTKIQNAWHKLRTAAKLDDVKFHDLRHTFAGNLAAADVSLHKICQLLGHSDLKMTMRYAKLAPQHLDEIDILDDVFG